MDERLFARLDALVAQQPVVLASVLTTRGAVPRKAGSRMLVWREGSAFSIGGGLAEARVIDAALALLRDGGTKTQLDIALNGGPDAAGICGGNMTIGLRCWHGADAQTRVRTIAARLAAGDTVSVDAAELGATSSRPVVLQPDARLLIVGGGHCSLALYDLARHLDFDLCVFDPRPSCFEAGQFAQARVLCGDVDTLDAAFDGMRPVYAVLLNRDYGSDVASLRVLARHRLAFIGMMGSRRRVAEVRRAAAEFGDVPTALQAPVGMEIGAETPHEIAISILAQVVAARAAHRSVQPA